MTVREQETLLRALDLWRAAVGQMNWEERANAALDLPHRFGRWGFVEAP